jgi:hypothetical protein
MGYLGAVLAATAVSYLVGGAALTRRGLWASGALLAGTGGLLLTAAGLGGPASDGTPGLLLLGATHVGALALVCFPRPALRSPVDLASLVLLLAAVSALLAVSAQEGRAVDTVRGVTTTVAGTALMLHTWWRLERADADERWPLLWMSLSAGTAALGCGVVAFVMPGTAGAVLICVLAALVPPALWVGVTRPRLSDVRGLVGEAVVLATTLAVYVAGLQALAAGLEILNGRPLSTPGLVGLAAACSLVVQPVRTLLRGVVDEVLFGRRPDPLRAASRVVDELGDDPAGALEAVRRALVLPYAAVRTADGAVVLASGEPGAALRAVPLPWHGPGSAELVVGLRPGDLRLGAPDEQVLRLVAPLLAQTLRARAAAAEQRTSRELTVRAVEEERRRLRRDLHDGLGPRLSGIAFSSDAARNTVRTQPDVAEQLLTAVRVEATMAMAEIRQLVYGMRPPALDELGLLPALQQHAATLRTPDERLLQVRYELGELPPLQAAWEVAVYRIVAGALDNVARHSGADCAAVRIAAADGTLVLEVRDEGRPGPPRAGAAARPGVGTSSMRERAAELGGTLASGPEGHGWLVRAVLPLPREP